MEALTIETVAATRERLWDAGFRPVPVLNADHGDPKVAGKAPIGRDWGNRARQDPPECIRFAPVSHALNTGILCDGLRAIDIDIDDPEVATRCRSFVVQRFGEAPIRMRRNSPRCLILYRAASGTPSKIVLAGTAGKIEVLGKGQQFVAFGKHPTGAELEWFPDAPGQEPLNALPAIAEDDVMELLDVLAPVIGAEPIKRTNGHDRVNGEAQADPLRVAAALNAIPNTGPPDWEAWNRIGMAIWAATGGSEMGLDAFDAWSRRHPAYDQAETERRWQHYFTSPPTGIGAGTLFYMAREAGKHAEPEPPPHEEPQPTAPSLPLLWFREIEPVLDCRDFVQGLLMEQSAAVVYGQSNSGKTFWTTDLALHVAAGHEWCGRRVEQGGVIYCVLEGGIGFRNRVTAWRDARGLGSYDLPFVAIPASINLLKPDGDVDRLIDAVQFAASKMAVPVKLIVIDTLARALAGGNENAPDDMGLLVANMDLIREKCQAMVLFVHHSGKDQARGARGHSSLQAAIDTEIEVEAPEDGETRSATVVKQREMRKGDRFGFSLKVIELGENRHNEKITTCLVSPDGRDDGTKRDCPLVPSRRSLTSIQRRALEILIDITASYGTRDARVPAGQISVPADAWRNEFYLRAMPAVEQDTKKHAFGRASSALINLRLVGMAVNRVWAVQMHDRFAPSFGDSNETGRSSG